MEALEAVNMAAGETEKNMREMELTLNAEKEKAIQEVEAMVRRSVKGLNDADRVAVAMAIDVGDVFEGRLGVSMQPEALREVLEGRVV